MRAQVGYVATLQRGVTVLGVGKWPYFGVSLAGRHQLGVIDRMSRVIASEATG